MKFWGLEVEPNQSVKVLPDDEHLINLSWGALGEANKGDKATIFVKVNGQKLAIGTLSTDKFPQIQFNLAFDKEFELSHNSKTSSVFFSGYKVFQPAEGDEMNFDSEEEKEQIIPAVTKENGKPEAKEQKKQVKIDTAAPSKSKAAAIDIGKSKKDDDSDDDDDDESDDYGSEDDSVDEALIHVEDAPAEDSFMADNDNDSSDSSDDVDEEEETPKKQETGNKRAAGSVLKTRVADKKAKIATPSGQKTGDKKGAVQVKSPHPANKAGKTPATSKKSPKSGGSFACKSCTKKFDSEIALKFHSKAKHPAKREETG